MSLSTALFDFIETKLSPISARVGSQRHVMAIRDGFFAAIPFMIVGSFVLVFAFPPFSPDTNIVFCQWWLHMATKYMDQIMTPYNMSMNIMAIYIAAGIAYNLAKSYKQEPFSAAMLALMTFLLVASPMMDGALPAGNLGGRGIFTAIIVGIFTVELVRLLQKYHIGIHLPEQVPEKIRASFDMLIPAVAIFLTIYPANLYLLSSFGLGLPDAIMAIFQPLVAASDTLPAILIAVLLCHVLWFSGIHGAAIVQGILTPFYLVNLTANQEAFAAGLPLPHVFIEQFWAFFIVIGGSGSTLALLLLYLRSGSAHLRSIGKLAAVPAIFNINEPIIFGSPIVMNPVLFVPFVVAPLFNATVAYIACRLDIVGKVIMLVPWTTPAPIGAAWGAGWLVSNAVLVFALIFVDLLIYWPFVKVYERQLIAQEGAETSVPGAAVPVAA